MDKNKGWEVERHSGVDKSFGMGNNSIWMKVNYDDVNHPEVDAAVKYITEIIDRQWNDKVFMTFYRTELFKQWNEDKYLQEEYPDVAQYLEERIGHNH